MSHGAVRKIIDTCLYKHGFKAPGQLGYHGSSQRVRQAYLLLDRPRSGITLDLLRRKLTHIGVRLPLQRWRAFFVDVLARAGVAVDAGAESLPAMPFKVFVTDVLLPEAAASVPAAGGGNASTGASGDGDELHPVMGFVSGCATLPRGGHMRARRAHPAEVRSGSTRSAFEAKAPAFNVTLFRQRGRDTPGTPSSSASRGGTRPWTTGSGYGRSGAANEALSVTNIARVPDATGRFKPLDSLYRSRLHDLPIQLGVG